MKRTQQEIERAIADLQEIKPRVLHYSAFGDDHHAAIDAQIAMLSGELSEDDIYDYDGRYVTAEDAMRAVENAAEETSRG